MRVLGVKSVKVTNARGFCLELSTAITVVVASRFGAGLSFMHCHAIATFAVGTKQQLHILRGVPIRSHWVGLSALSLTSSDVGEVPCIARLLGSVGGVRVADMADSRLYARVCVCGRAARVDHAGAVRRHLCCGPV